MHHSCQSDVVQQSVITRLVRKCTNVLGKLFESGIYKLPVTSPLEDLQQSLPGEKLSCLLKSLRKLARSMSEEKWEKFRILHKVLFHSRVMT